MGLPKAAGREYVVTSQTILNWIKAGANPERAGQSRGQIRHS